MRLRLGIVAAIGLALPGIADCSPSDPARVFAGKQGCFILRELQTGKTVQEYNPDLCRERIYACSTFKIALAVMGFDSTALQDEDTIFKWDGTHYDIPSWNKDQTARSWLAGSVVWYSQKLTPLLGMRRIRAYLADFRYGNRDFSGGLTKAWLSSSLKISAREQTEFLRRLRLGKLKVNSSAVQKTLAIIPEYLDQGSVRLSGKTGTGFSWEDPAEKDRLPYYRVGWYVGYASKDSKDYVFATVFKEKTEKGRWIFGGPEAKKMSLELLGLSEKTR